MDCVSTVPFALTEGFTMNTVLLSKLAELLRLAYLKLARLAKSAIKSVAKQAVLLLLLVLFVNLGLLPAETFLQVVLSLM